MLFSILKSIFALGLPVFLMTWYLFRRLYERGELQAGIDNDERSKQLKSIKKQKSGRDNLLHRNWMKFGGGFYGTTAATTLVCIEFLDMWQFVFQFPGWSTLFEGGPIAFLVGLLVNQIQNFIQAALWFTYWGQHDGSLLLWIAAAYGSYLLGLRAAEKSLSEWQEIISLWWEKRA
jgi:hypothetical protein